MKRITTNKRPIDTQTFMIVMVERSRCSIPFFRSQLFFFVSFLPPISIHPTHAIYFIYSASDYAKPFRILRALKIGNRTKIKQNWMWQRDHREWKKKHWTLRISTHIRKWMLLKCKSIEILYLLLWSNVHIYIYLV